MSTDRVLKTLEQHNAERAREYTDTGEYLLNGIACPRCEEELVDCNSAPTLIHGSPPQQRVRCLTCGWDGLRLA